MPDPKNVTSRKADHIRINLEEDVRSAITTGLERFRFIHQALPEMNLQDVNMGQMLFGRQVNAPILISSMTGGTREAAIINQRLAEAAQQYGLVMGVGSQRAGIEHPEEAVTFQVRRYAPDILLFANLGAVQLNYGYSILQCQQAVDMIQADGLILHLNGLQEALQPEGDTHLEGLLIKIEQICRVLPVPVIIKEVGWGISPQTVDKLKDVGIAAIDVAGAGGTSWSQVEKHRMKDERLSQVAAAFRNWGIPTAESIQNVRQSAPQMTVFASGGLKDGIDIAKCIALGANLGGMAGPFLKVAATALEDVIDFTYVLMREIQICMFASGCGTLTDLQKVALEEFK